MGSWRVRGTEAVMFGVKGIMKVFFSVLCLCSVVVCFEWWREVNHFIKFLSLRIIIKGTYVDKQF